MFSKHDQLQGYDDELLAAMDAEDRRQEDHIELIASENYASKRVMQAQGSGLTNKYAEGYPGKRYYGGCEHVDKVERLAIDRARQLFGADYANVQPHSGSSANAAVYLALLNAGDTILGMSLAHGGHLTHGAKVSSSGKLYNAVQYGLDTATGLIDYDEVERLAVEHKPKMIVAGFSAYPRPSTSRASAPSPTRSAPTCSSTWPTSPAWSPPASTRTRSLRRRGHHHHPQDPARPARRPDPGARQRGDREEAQLRGIPRRPGRPADARDRGQGGVLQGSAGAGLQGLPGAGDPQRQGDGRGVHRARLRRGFRWHRQPPDADQPGEAGADRQGRRRGARSGAHHGEQERRAERSTEPVRHLRHPHRHPSGDHSRFPRGRVPRTGWLDLRHPRRYRQSRGRRTGQGQVGEFCRHFPVYAD